jgi:hypothetical protein
LPRQDGDWHPCALPDTLLTAGESMSFKNVIWALPLVLAGCGIVGFGPGRQVELETHATGIPYAGLTDKSVAIVVWAPLATLDEYPGAPEEISTFVATQMRGHMPTTRPVDPQQIIRWQADTLNWQNLPAADIGRHFQADRVLVIDVLDYSTRRPLGVSNLQGRLRAECKIYDTARAAAEPAPGRPAWTGLVDAAWPSGKPLDPTQTNETAVRQRTLDAFADVLVRYFYVQREPESSISG